MKYALVLVSLFALSCSTKTKTIKPNLSAVKANKTGALLTVDLNTSGFIKRGQKCRLVIDQKGSKYNLDLKEGAYNYALPLSPGVANLQELNCGMFYYYKLEDRGTWFEVKNGQISYLGTIDFSLADKGEMTWGPSTKSRRLLEGHLGEMGLTGDEVVVEPLKL